MALFETKMATKPDLSWINMPLEVKQMIITAFIDGYVAEAKARPINTGPIGSPASTRQAKKLLGILAVFGGDTCRVPLQRAISLVVRKYEYTARGSRDPFFFRMWWRLDHVLNKLTSQREVCMSSLDLQT